MPTFGEADNIVQLIEDIENLHLDLSILVIDDSSPNGTVQIIEEKQIKYSNLFLCSRPKKLGLGTAITDGFKVFLSQNQPPKYILTMDTDYSHNPKDLPKLLAVMQQYKRVMS